MAHIGIDLGTTNSSISIAQLRPDGRIIASPIEIDRVTDAGSSIDGKTTYTKARARTLPSCVFYHPSTGRCIVGDHAKDQFKKYPESVVKSVKSHMANPALPPELTVPESSPAAVSAQVLKHLKHYAEMAVRQKITSPVICVPANFDAASRIATMEAALLAGFDVKNEDGTWKPLLLSEPNAVLYDLCQKILNGEVAESVLDLSKKNRVLVFDIGGGTLDVTIHEIEQAADGSLNLSEIATSRYTLLAGDDFDAVIADNLFARCIRKFETYEPNAVPRIMTRKELVKKMLRVAAERLKIDMNDKAESGGSDFDDWFSFDDTPADGEVMVEISQSIGDERIYNDVVTKTEFEEMVAPLLGGGLHYDDYKGYASNRTLDRKNIIAPILDVLEKAVRHYEKMGEAFHVDAVILNGGMSRLYLIRDRIRDFFGIEPITTADPDLAVSGGAAVYAAIMERSGLDYKHPAIYIERQIQNEDLWLGLSAGANAPIIAEGDVLPCSNVIDGFRVPAEVTNIVLPIKRRLPTGEWETLARGVIAFNAPRAKKEASLQIACEFDKSGLLSICAYLLDSAGRRIDTGVVEIALGETKEKAVKKGGMRILPAQGTALVPANELDMLKTYHLQTKLKNRPALIESRMRTILSCGNPEDFEDAVIRHLTESRDASHRMSLYSIVEGMADHWSAAGRRKVSELAGRDIVSEELMRTVSCGPMRRRLSDHAAKIAKLMRK